MRKVFLLLLLAFSAALFSQRSYVISGTVFETDTTQSMPFVYLINSRTGNGTVTDYNGRFSIIAKDKDTLTFQYLGYARRRYPVSIIKNINDSMKQNIKVVMQPVMINMQGINVYANSIKPNEIDYMKRYIKQHAALKGVDAFNSPITALYDQFSRKGREQRKLQQIFEEILIREEVNKKINPEILRQLTEDDFVDYEAFKKYCWYISDQYILTHEGYDLYAPIMDCYRRYKRDGK